MKRTYTLFLTTLLICCTNLYSQTFSDDFESYTVGSYLGQSSPSWTTWSGTTGGSEDVKIVSNDYHSGGKSIYFSSTSSAGGPQDVVLPFGGAYTTGQFAFEMWLKVESGKGGYFNFQASQTIGQLWAMECYMLQTGDLFLTSDGGTLAQTTFTANTWFKLTITINLNTNEWELFLDGVSKGTFSNPVNQIASLDIYPVNSTNSGGNNQAGFWVDDVVYNYIPYTLQPRNGAVIDVVKKLKVAGQTLHPFGKIRNLGTQPITSFDLKVDYNGNQTTESISGVNIPSLGTYDYKFNGTVSAVTGSNPLSLTISNVNGTAADDDPADDTKIITVDPISPAPGKLVIGEEATGTWCGWCPRGTVAMAEMAEYFEGFFKGIAVHNGDPMTNSVYDGGIGPLIGGYPSALVDRGPEIDPSEFETGFMQRIIVAPSAMITMDKSYNSTTKMLDVAIHYKFTKAVSGIWRAGCVVVEDSVHGVGSSWSQANYYSFQTNNAPLVGAGINWQTATDPVPAAQMWYNDVARVIEPGFNGQTNSFPTSINIGDSFTIAYSIQIEPDWNTDHLEIIGLLFNNTGLIDNGSVAEFPDENTGITQHSPDLNISLYPNPSYGEVAARFQLAQATEVLVQVTDISGKTVLANNYGVLDGNINLPLSLVKLESGIYLVKVNAGHSSTVRKLVITK